MDRIEWAFLVGILVIVGAMGFGFYEENQKENRFMAECQADHKRYACEALWRQGEAHTVVAPVPVYITR